MRVQRSPAHDPAATSEPRREPPGAAAPPEDRFRRMVERIPAIVYIETDEWPAPATYMSPRIEQVLGLPPAAFEDRDIWLELVHPDDLENFVLTEKTTARTHEPYVCEYRARAADGTYVWFRDEALFVPEEGGYWQGVMMDITDRKRAEVDLTQALEMEREAVGRLREADEMKNTFLTAVSHDLRTPLAAILGNAVTLEHEDELGISPEERRELAHRLAEKARQLTGIVTDLLDLDRLVRGGADAHRARVDVGQIVRRCAHEADVGDRTLHVEAEPLYAAVDPPMLERIVENLLANSRHTPEGTTIWVRVGPVADGSAPGALLVVEDDGPGVPLALRETLFLPFERGPSANPHAPGSGVGLSLVANFAALHGGRAWIEERAGGGASFRVSLPG
jgi:PAS domain S-box-containing protein